MRKLLVQICAFTTLFISLSCSNSTTENFRLTEELDADQFTLDVPEGWPLIVDQGIDTYVGRIVSLKDTIYFDYGYLSFGGLEHVEANENTISIESLQINGNSSKLVKERRPEDIGNEIRLSMYIDSGDEENLNRLYSYDPQNEALILSIMKSHKFSISQ